MRAPSKLNTWQDGDIPGNIEPESSRPDGNTESKGSEDTPEDQSPVAKKVKNISAKDAPSLLNRKVPEKEQTPSTAQEKPVASLPLQQDESVAEHTEQGPASDMDWMRSRTSRLLGLVEDDEGEGKAAAEDSGVKSPLSEGSVVPEEKTTMPPHVNHEAPPEAVAEPEAQVEVLVDEIRKSGRLYLRNLAYTVTEEELREQFMPWTSLQEVCCHFFLESKFRVRQRMNFQIGTTYVQTNDVTWEIILVDASLILIWQSTKHLVPFCG